MGEFWQKNGAILLGGITQGFGMGVFLFPNDIPSGGAGGLTVLINYLTGMDVGLALWIVNFTLLAIGMKYLGKISIIGTFWAITVTSIAIYIYEAIIHIPVRFIWFDLIVGSMFLGLGIGILIRQGFSNGGVGVIAVIISEKRNILPGKPLFLINVTIFLLTASIISWNIFFYAIISQWISTNIVNLVCTVRLYETYTIDWLRKT
ncbi:YitT family protein [Bacillaceae bacterium W0354]